MSRVGNKIINVPNGVTIQDNNGTVVVKGPLGEDNIQLIDGIGINIDGDLVTVVIKDESGETNLSPFHGLSRALINNMIVGVTNGFEKELEIIGVGYRAAQQDKNVQFQLGYSHPILFSPPAGITVEVVDPTKIKIKGINRQQVGQVAANIRKLRPPEPYKGKGIRYKDEYVRRKAGKAGK